MQKIKNKIMGLFGLFSNKKKETLDKGLEKTKESVFGKFIDTDGFCYYWSRIILAIRFLDSLVLVLH